MSTTTVDVPTSDGAADALLVVLVPNVLHRAGRAPGVNLVDLVAPEDRSSMMTTLGPLMQAVTPERAVADTAAYPADAEQRRWSELLALLDRTLGRRSRDLRTP